MLVRSSIHSTLMRRVLFRGTWIAGIGASLFLFAGLFATPAILHVWGLPLFLAALAAIAYGLLPFCRLKRLETNPYVLNLEGEWLHFMAKGKPVLSIPIQSIKTIAWIE